MNVDSMNATAADVMTLFLFAERLRLAVPCEMRDIAWANGTVITG